MEIDSELLNQSDLLGIYALSLWRCLDLKKSMHLTIFKNPCYKWIWVNLSEYVQGLKFKVGWPGFMLKILKSCPKMLLIFGKLAFMKQWLNGRGNAMTAMKLKLQKLNKTQLLRVDNI